jgi:anthraniloyl-CoA monooxygenase
MIAYMTRTGNVALQRFAGTNPDIVRRGLARFADVDPPHVPVDEVTDWVLSRPLVHGEREWPRRTLAVSDRDRLSAPAPDADDPPTSQADLARVVVDVHDPWGTTADALVKRLHDLTLIGWTGFWLVGATDRAAVLTRLDVGERLRCETGGLVVVEAPRGMRDDLAAGLASARADLVCLLTDRT